MSQENVRKFEERLRDDEALQVRLKELADAFDGDKNDPKAVFEAVVTPLAAEAGLPHTYDEALECVAQRDDDEDLTADEVKAAAGGWSDLCAFVGFGDVNADACFDDVAGYNACAGIGVGFAMS